MNFQAVDIHAGYVPGIDILRGLSIEARDGEVTTVIGANGVGKSTFLKCAIGQLRPHSGTISYGDLDLTRLETHDLVRHGIAYLAQGRNIFPHMSVLENLQMGVWSIRDDRDRCSGAIERAFEGAPILGDFKHRRAGEMSGGQQRVLEIQRALMTDPTLLLIDEPSVGLDPKMTDMIYDHLRALASDHRHTILIVDQNVIAGTDIADHIYVLELGANKFDCTKRDFDGTYRETIAEWLI